jgi:hypothetical protein
MVDKKASWEGKEKFLEYIHRPINGNEELINCLKLDKHVENHFIRIII